MISTRRCWRWSRVDEVKSFKSSSKITLKFGRQKPNRVCRLGFSGHIHIIETFLHVCTHQQAQMPLSNSNFLIHDKSIFHKKKLFHLTVSWPFLHPKMHLFSSNCSVTLYHFIPFVLMMNLWLVRFPSTRMSGLAYFVRQNK